MKCFLSSTRRCRFHKLFQWTQFQCTRIHIQRLDRYTIRYFDMALSRIRWYQFDNIVLNIPLCSYKLALRCQLGTSHHSCKIQRCNMRNRKARLGSLHDMCMWSCYQLKHLQWKISWNIWQNFNLRLNLLNPSRQVDPDLQGEFSHVTNRSTSHCFPA